MNIFISEFEHWKMKLKYAKKVALLYVFEWNEVRWFEGNGIPLPKC
jgi:hypothetical protein